MRDREGKSTLLKHLIENNWRLRNYMEDNWNRHWTFELDKEMQEVLE